MSYFLQGRNGKGNIFVFAVGNGGQSDDSCALNGHVSSIYTIAAGGVRYDGYETMHDEHCSARLISAYTDGILVRNVVSYNTVTPISSIVRPKLGSMCSYVATV